VCLGALCQSAQVSYLWVSSVMVSSTSKDTALIVGCGSGMQVLPGEGVFAKFGDRGEEAESGGAAFGVVVHDVDLVEELGDGVGEVGGGAGVVVEVGDSFEGGAGLAEGVVQMDLGGFGQDAGIVVGGGAGGTILRARCMVWTNRSKSGCRPGPRVG
jgi:hypothetical protein